MAGTSSTTPSDQIQITNNSTVPVVVLDSITTSSGQISNKVLAPVSGQSNIGVGLTDSVTLNDTYTDSSGKVQPSLLYQLIFSTTDWLMPIQVSGVMQNFVTGAYSPLSITAANQQGMKNAMSLTVMMSAYPSSTIAKGYANALQAGSTSAQTGTAGGATSAESSVNAYLATLTNYPGVTFDMMVGVQNYLNTYPFAWARQSKSMTYYLYSTDGTNPTTLQGSVVFTQTGSVPNASDANGGYSIIFTDTKGNQKPLTYAKGLLVDDPTTSFPDVALQGSFVLKSRLTANAADNSVISVLSGSVAGMNMLGLDTLQTQPGSSQRGFWQTLFDPQGAQQIFNSIMQIGGFLMLLHFVGSTTWSIIQKVRGKNGGNLSQDEVSKEVGDMKTQLQETNSKLANKEQPEPDTNLDDSASQMDKAVSDQIDVTNQTSLESRIDVASERLEGLADVAPPTTQMEDTAVNLRDANQALQEKPYDASTITDQSTVMDGVDTNLNQMQSSVINEVSDEMRAQMEAQAKASSDLSENEEKINEETDDASDGKMPEGEEEPDMPFDF